MQTDCTPAPRIAPPRPQAAVFDFDGTLARLTIDFDAMRRAVVERLADAGLGDYARSDRPVLEMIADACAALEPPACEDLRSACVREVERIEVDAARHASLLPGVREALAKLRAERVRVGVITRNCRAAVLLAGPDILERVDALVAREDTPSVKPDPAHVTTCLHLLGALDGRVAVVGDHPMDMETALAGGWRGFGVLSGAGNLRTLYDAGAEAVYADVPEFVAAVLSAVERA